jgi:hypothetical protein
VLLKCIQLLEDCDPTGEVPDQPELAFYEHMSVNQAPLIDQRLAQIDKQHNMLAQVDIAIRDVLASYDSAVQQVQYQVRENVLWIGDLVYIHPSIHSVLGTAATGHSTSGRHPANRSSPHPAEHPNSTVICMRETCISAARHSNTQS